MGSMGRMLEEASRGAATPHESRFDAANAAPRAMVYGRDADGKEVMIAVVCDRCTFRQGSATANHDADSEQTAFTGRVMAGALAVLHDLASLIDRADSVGPDTGAELDALVGHVRALRGRVLDAVGEPAGDGGEGDTQLAPLEFPEEIDNGGQADDTDASAGGQDDGRAAPEG